MYLRGYFLLRKSEDAGGLSPGKDDNAAERKIDREDVPVSRRFDYTFSYI
jgi:hypothetical protein